MDTPEMPGSKPFDQLAQNLRHAVEDADQLLRQTVRSGDAQFDAMRDKFESQLRRMRLQLDELEDTAAYKARQAARVTDEAVHAHPYTAIGVAGAVGLLVGIILARR